MCQQAIEKIVKGIYVLYTGAFENMTRVDGLTFLLMQALGYKIDIQPQPFTMKDYIEQTGLVDEILRTGMEMNVTNK